MRRILAVLLTAHLVVVGVAYADGEDVDGTADTVGDIVRVMLWRTGGDDVVRSVSRAGSEQRGCGWSILYTPNLDDAPYGTTAGPKPHPDARFALLLCDGSIVRAIWVAPSDVVDVDAAVAGEVERYVRDVLAPGMSIGANPATKGLAGLRSWFWVAGFDGEVTAPPITAFGLSVEVRMSSERVTWRFGDGTEERGDLGRAYPQESTVQHAYRDGGTYSVDADVHLEPEYRVGQGPWLALPGITATVTTTHPVDEREPVITDA